MARIRTIKPDFFRHETLYEAERAAGLPLRLAFAGLWTVADREGRFRWRPRALKLDVMPYDEADFAAILDALHAAGFLVRYRVDGEDFGAIPSWGRHQVINKREAASSLPVPDQGEPVPAPGARGDAHGNAPVKASACTGQDISAISKGLHTPPVDNAPDHAQNRQIAPQVIDSTQRLVHAPALSCGEVEGKGKGSKEKRARIPADPPQGMTPDGVDPQAWAKWDAYRRKTSGKKWTPEAVALSATKLREFGSNALAVVEQSIANGWTGLFPLKAEKAFSREGSGANGAALAWVTSDRGTIAKGKELGIEARVGESMEAFRDRVIRANADHARGAQ